MRLSISDNDMEYFQVLEETGPAILISALTNILADAVGSITGSPSITVLCFGNMLSIFMDYVYQVSLLIQCNLS